MLSKIVFIFLTLHTVHPQKPSPCPEILVYEQRNAELDRWNAVINLSSPQDLKGIWLRITLDRPAELLGNVFGEATSSDNQEFLIRSQNYILEAGTTTPVRFFVKYNAASVVPSVSEINLNGRALCSSTNPVYEQTTEKIIQTRPTSNSIGLINRPRPTSLRPSGTSSTSRTVTKTRPTNTKRPTNNFSNNNDNINPELHSNRPSRPSSSGSNTFNNNNENINSEVHSNRPSRPSSSGSNNFNTAGDNFNNGASSSNFNRPTNSFNADNFNTGSDTFGVDNEYGNNFNNNRPLNAGTSFGSNRDPDNFYNQNNNQGGGDDFFAGDFSAVVNRPPSNPSVVRPSINRDHQCGTIAAQPRPLISYGQNTTPGQWPWHAALYHSKGIQLMYTCGGTLISRRHILTAAHCVTKPHTSRAINPQNILVYLGKYNLKKFGSEIQDKEVSDIYVHPEYNSSVYYNDIAILRLSDPAQITNFVRPVCLWEDSDDLNEIEGQQGTVVGWGFDHNRELSTTLMQAQMPIVSTVTCIYSNREFFSQFTSERSFCAGFKNGTSVCNGDSGGGMVFPRRGTGGSNTVWQIRGLVSVGVALQGQGVCDPSQYIVFTDVAKHSNWIQLILSNYP